MTIASPPQYPPRRNGCLWGCLILVLIVTVPPVLAVGYGAWYFWEGYRHNPAYRLAVDLVRHDGMAQQVLGQGVVVTGVVGNVFHWIPGQSNHDDYDVTLQGSKGEGYLSMTSHLSGLDGWKLDSAILTGPDGRRYDLLKDQQLPGDGSTAPETSI